jgi:hypothetical protein
LAPSGSADKREQLVEHFLEPGETFGGRHLEAGSCLSPSGVHVAPIKESRFEENVFIYRHYFVRALREQRHPLNRGRARRNV